MSQPESEKCENCKYYKQNVEAANGTCLRNPPAMNYIGADNRNIPMYQSMNPAVAAHEWCGEWEPEGF